jgi:hypothetical protein
MLVIRKERVKKNVYSLYALKNNIKAMLHILYSAPVIFEVIKPRRMRNAYRILSGESERKKPPRRLGGKK